MLKPNVAGSKIGAFWKNADHLAARRNPLADAKTDAYSHRSRLAVLYGRIYRICNLAYRQAARRMYIGKRLAPARHNSRGWPSAG